jgi:hypothetical protein
MILTVSARTVTRPESVVDPESVARPESVVDLDPVGPTSLSAEVYGRC